VVDINIPVKMGDLTAAVVTSFKKILAELAGVDISLITVKDTMQTGTVQGRRRLLSEGVQITFAINIPLINESVEDTNIQAQTISGQLTTEAINNIVLNDNALVSILPDGITVVGQPQVITNTPESEQGSDIFIIAVGAISTLMLIVILVVIIFCCCRKKKPPALIPTAHVMNKNPTRRFAYNPVQQFHNQGHAHQPQQLRNPGYVNPPQRFIHPPRHA
jgi:hypothetical protein